MHCLEIFLTTDNDWSQAVTNIFISLSLHHMVTKTSCKNN